MKFTPRAARIKYTPMEEVGQCLPSEISNKQTATAAIQLNGSRTPMIVVNKVDTIDVGKMSLLSKTITKRMKEAMMKGNGTCLVFVRPLSCTVIVVFVVFSFNRQT
jgi:hypothetical protein